MNQRHRAGAEEPGTWVSGPLPVRPRLRHRGRVPPVYSCGSACRRAGRGTRCRGEAGPAGLAAGSPPGDFFLGRGGEGGARGGVREDGEGSSARLSLQAEGRAHRPHWPGGPRAPLAPPPGRPGSLPRPPRPRLPLASPRLRPSRRWRTCCPPRSLASRQENPASFLISPAFPLTQSRHQLIRGTEGKRRLINDQLFQSGPAIIALVAFMITR